MVISGVVFRRNGRAGGCVRFFCVCFVYVLRLFCGITGGVPDTIPYLALNVMFIDETI